MSSYTDFEFVLVLTIFFLVFALKEFLYILNYILYIVYFTYFILLFQTLLAFKDFLLNTSGPKMTFSGNSGPLNRKLPTLL